MEINNGQLGQRHGGTDVDVVIVGAGPAGLSAAIFTRLDGWKTLVLESRWVGGQGAIAYTVSNYPGFPPADGATLLENMKNQVVSSPPTGVGAEIRQERVLSIDAGSKLVTTDQNQYRAEAVILATGSIMQRLGAPGEDRFVGRGVSYCAKKDCSKFHDKNIMVVGGGNSTVKSGLMAKIEGKAKQVILIHRKDSLRAYPAMAKRLEMEGIKVWYNAEIREIKGNEKVEIATVVNTKTNEEKDVAVDWIIICIGTEVNTRLAQEAGIEMAGKFVRVNEQMMTNKEGIFACGEIAGSKQHLINASASGASAGIAASEYLALEMVRRGEMFKGAKNGKYAEEYLSMSDKQEGSELERGIKMVIPLHRVNVLTGIKSARVVEDASQYASLIRKARRPLLVLGPLLEQWSLDGRLAIDYALEIARAVNVPLCATATLKGKMVELGAKPDSVYDGVEIVNHLKDPEWSGVRKEGNHDLVIFFGIRSDLEEQLLSVLKHFAFGHLKTMTLDKYYFPHANYSLPNFRKETQWKAFLESLISELGKEE